MCADIWKLGRAIDVNEHDLRAGNGRARTQKSRDDFETEIEAGRESRGAVDSVFLRHQQLRGQPNLRIGMLEVARQPPGRRSLTSVKQSSFGQKEDRGTVSGQVSSFLVMLPKRASPHFVHFSDAVPHGLSIIGTNGWHEDKIRPPELLQSTVGRQIETGHCAYRSPIPGNGSPFERRPVFAIHCCPVQVGDAQSFYNCGHRRGLAIVKDGYDYLSHHFVEFRMIFVKSDTPSFQTAVSSSQS